MRPGRCVGAGGVVRRVAGPAVGGGGRRVDGRDSQGGPLHFELPERKTGQSPLAGSVPASSAVLLTRDELKLHERESIVAALTQSRGKIFGVNGASELLGMIPTTLASRIKALGIEKPSLGHHGFGV